MVFKTLHPRWPMLAACWLLAASSVHAATVQGKLELANGPHQRVAAGEVSEGLVYFLPKGDYPAPKPGTFTMKTHSKGFDPSLLVVPVGSTIEFPNRDTILHNVFSRTPGSAFDFGFYGAGETRRQVFSKPGLVAVNCSVHHVMRANVIVLATPYYTRPGHDGRFTLTDLPAGPGTLVYWHPRASAASAQVTIPLPATQRQQLIATKPRLDQGMESGR